MPSTIPFPSLCSSLRRCTLTCSRWCDADRCLDIFDSMAGSIGPLLISLAVILIGTSVSLFYGFILPHYQSSDGDVIILPVAFHYLTSTWLIVMIAFNYYMVVRTDPGSPPAYQDSSVSLISTLNPSMEEPVSAITDDSSDGDSRRQSLVIEMEEPLDAAAQQRQPPKVCAKCRRFKPERTHHCSVCGRCILKMDHNCVGHYNHRYFYLFMLYLWLGCIYYLYMGISPWTESLTSADTYFDKDGQIQTAKFAIQKLLLLTIMLGFALFFALGGMLGWHTYMISRNQTTIEFMEKQSPSRNNAGNLVHHRRFDIGLKTNLRFFFNLNNGRGWWTILLPMPVPPTGDGRQFPSLVSHESYNFDDGLRPLRSGNIS